MKYLYFIWKNLGRKKARTILTILSIAVAFLLFGLLRTLGDAFSQGAEIAGEDRLMVIHKISLIQPLPYSYVARVRALDGVANVSHANWFGGYYQDQRNQFPQFAVDHETYFEIYKDLYSLPEEQMQAWKRNRIGAVVGSTTAERFGWKVGDRVPIIGTIYPLKDGSFTWDFVIEGVYTAKDPRGDSSTLLFRYDYFDEAQSYGGGTIGWMIVQLDDPARAEEVADAIDTMFANSFAETKTSSEKEFAASFAKQLGDIGLITTYILGAVFFTMLLVAGNTMAQSVRERIPELAILKTLGFSDGAVLGLVLAESILVALIGGALGVLLSVLAVGGLAAGLSTFLPGLVFPSKVAVQALVVMIMLGFFTGILPALQGMRLNIVTALGRR